MHPFTRLLESVIIPSRLLLRADYWTSAHHTIAIVTLRGSVEEALLVLHLVIGGTNRSVDNFTPDYLTFGNGIWGSDVETILILMFCSADGCEQGRDFSLFRFDVHKPD